MSSLPRAVVIFLSLGVAAGLGPSGLPHAAGPETQALISLSIVGPGTSAADPALGATVQLKVECGDTACPLWVRVDRTDGISDTTPFVRLETPRLPRAPPLIRLHLPIWYPLFVWIYHLHLFHTSVVTVVSHSSPRRPTAPTLSPVPAWVRPIDEQYTFTWAPTFPYFFKPAWGVNTFMFGGSINSTTVTIVASGWSAEYNGTLIAPNSSTLDIHYSTAFEQSKTALAVADHGPGSVGLSLVNTAVTTFDTIRFDRYFPSNLTTTPPQFAPLFFFNQHSGTGSIVQTFQEPGVYYFGVTPTFQGRAGGASAGGVYGSCAVGASGQCQPSTTPTALVVTGPTGETGNQTVVPGFVGVVHHVTKLQTKHQFCLFERNLTVFSGAQVRLPLCRPGKAEQPPQPGFVSIVLPSWMTVQPLNNVTCVSCGQGAKGPELNSSVVLGHGLTRYTFASLGNAQRPENPAKPSSKYVDGYLPGHWTTYNNFVPLYLSFDAAHTHSVVSVAVMIHWTPEEASTVPIARWQSVQLRCTATPKLTTLPARLVTSITWAEIGADLMVDDGTDFWLDTYRGLGFNTVPMVSMPGAFNRWTLDNTSTVLKPTAPAYTLPSGRTGKGWDGLLFGPQVSDPNPSMGPEACRKPPNASLLPPGLTPTEIKIEMHKWANAFAFTNATKQLDVAYDGVWSRRATLEFCDLMHATQPDWVYVDDESFGEGWNSWKFKAGLSANAQARAMPGETPLDLAWRMAAEMMSSFTACLATVSPKTTAHWYGYGPDCPFPDRIFADAGISMGPSEYGQPHYLAMFADGLRQVKQQQSPMRGGKPRHLLPWLTACTYGQMDAVQAWEEALHSFGSGATGFAYFGVFFHGCFDDPAKLLALSTATALATPFEAHFLDGTPLIKGSVTATAGDLRAWSGMQLDESLWLVLTPGDQHGHTSPSTVTVQVALPPATCRSIERQDLPMAACDLTTGRTHSVSLSTSSLTLAAMQLTRTTVLHVGPGAAQACKAIQGNAWLPQPGYNY